MWTEAQLVRVARRAYELRRLRRGLLQALLFAPLGALTFLHCATSVRWNAAALLLVLALVAACSWAGRGWARGMRAGLLAGLAPLLVPLAAELLGHMCTESLCYYLPGACLLGGLLGGLVLAGYPGPAADTRAYAVAASAVTLACGLAGCLFAGLGGLAGLALGLTIGAVPVLVLRRV